MSPNRKVLIILSSADHITIEKKDGSTEDKPTGFFLKELGQPLLRLLRAGYEPVFANPKGNTPPMDPMSDSPIWFLSKAEYEKEKNLIEEMKVVKTFAHPRKFSDITDEELNEFNGVFVPGGHAPMTDLGDDADLGRILTHFHDRAKPTAVICHGPIALLSAHQPGKDFPYKGYKVTCYANKEEAANVLMWGGSPRKVEDALREVGVDVQTATVPMMPNIVVDREVISGEGPTSADQLGEKFVEILEKKV